MAFATTRKETLPKKGLVKNVITLSGGNLDTGFSDGMDLTDAINITMQVEGASFGASSVKIQVSNDGATFYDTSVATSRATAGIIAVAEIDRGYKQYRLASTGATGAFSLTCTLYSKIRQSGTP